MKRGRNSIDTMKMVGNLAMMDDAEAAAASRAGGGAGARRSGRQRIAPLQFWKLETVAYERKGEGIGMVLPTVKGVKREGTKTPAPRKRNTKRRAKAAKKDGDGGAGGGGGQRRRLKKGVTDEGGGDSDDLEEDGDDGDPSRALSFDSAPRRRVKMSTGSTQVESKEILAATQFDMLPARMRVRDEPTLLPIEGAEGNNLQKETKLIQRQTENKFRDLPATADRDDGLDVLAQARCVELYYVT